MELATRNFFIECTVQFEEDQLLDLPQYEAQEGVNTLPFPFDDDILSHVLDSDEEEKYRHYLDIEVVPHENLYLDPSPIPNQCPKPKWAEKLIEEARDGVGNLEDKKGHGLSI